MATNQQECSICMDSFKNPKLISCHHSFCYKCLEDYIRAKLRDGRFDCPLCRKSVELPIEGVAGFQTNFYIDDTDSGEKLSCDICGPESVASSRCLDCEENLCQACCFVHEKSKASRNHKISDLGSLDSRTKGKIRQRIFCDKHPEEEIKLFCKDCKVLLCYTCKAVRHENHATETVADAAADVKNSVQAQIKYITNKIESINASAHMGEELGRRINDAEVEEMEAVEEQRLQLIKVLDQEVAKMKDKIQNVYQDLRQQNAVFIRDVQAELKIYSDANNNAQNLINQRTDIEIIKKAQDLEQLTATVLSKNYETANICVEKKLFSPSEIKPSVLTSLIGMVTDSTEIIPDYACLSACGNKDDICEWIPQYFASESREVRVCHETGILCYDTQSKAIPVGQFIAPKPLSTENSKFSITILAPGSIKAIGIGLVPQNYCPDRQPGWNPCSIGYHADDGGIFVERSFHNYQTETCDVGDVMEVEINVQRKKGWFRKNGRQMFEFDISSKFGFYPCIGLHSLGEAVRLNETDVWAVENMNGPSKIPPDFRTYKYGNLWISPGKKICLTKHHNSYSGWLILHNPNYDPIGYMETIGKNVKLGQLNHNKQFVDFINITDIKEAQQINEVIVEWAPLDLGHKYSSKDLAKALKAMNGKYRHILSVGRFDAS
ncbi:hypothetical protein CHS0354_026900 [Potamilus streckersoni]|uniref:Uncharacterized protein n=1 Tax=Potamilus streckersoni TaxID=2493646 RepID=A0AAE0W073_9BIVA|nr:hypothetical protein CHS0354_026900 [Potamilus streckersoni]